MTTGLDETAPMRSNCWVNYDTTQSTETVDCAFIIQANQATVTGHVGVENGDQPSPVVVVYHLSWMGPGSRH